MDLVIARVTPTSTTMTISRDAFHQRPALASPFSISDYTVQLPTA